MEKISKACFIGYAGTLLAYVIAIGIDNPKDYSFVGLTNALLVVSSDLM